MLFHGYMDESYDRHQKLFAFSCLIASRKDWAEMERAWKLHLAAKNKQLKKAGRQLLSRYHATDCSSMHGEYEGWDATEQIEFVKGLFGIFKRSAVHAVGYDVNLDDLCEVFPEWAGDRLEVAYSLLTKFVMETIGEDFTKMGKSLPATVKLFHDRTANGKYDATILHSFDHRLADEGFDYARYFTTITPLTCKDAVALQPADLVAFEVFKEAERKAKERQQRKSFKALLDMYSFGIHTRSFTRRVLTKLRERIYKDKPLSGAASAGAEVIAGQSSAAIQK